jgi:gamma-glutamylputrescine oxidase
MLLGGGSALTTFTNQWYNNERVIDSVIRDFKSRFPFLKNLHFLQYWPGQIDTTRDLLPSIFKDPQQPHIHYALGIVGLPWASFCGDFLARVILGKAQHDQQKYFSFLSERRHFALPVGLEKAFGKPAVFALNNLWAKYYQVDTKRDLKFEKGEF